MINNINKKGLFNGRFGKKDIFIILYVRGAGDNLLLHNY